MKQTKFESFKQLMQSSRFQGILAIGFLQSLALFGVITDAQGQGLIVILQAIIAGAIVVRTADRNLGDPINKITEVVKK